MLKKSAFQIEICKIIEWRLDAEEIKRTNCPNFAGQLPVSVNLLKIGANRDLRSSYDQLQTEVKIDNEIYKLVV